MDQIKPSVTVIMPTHNVERYVEQSIKSVLAQTLKDFELLIVDDASTDRTLEICERLARSDRRIKIVRHDRNRGPGPARNTALDNASGEFIFFLDADDLITNNALEKLIAVARSNNADVVHCNAFVRRKLKPDGSLDGDEQLKSDRVLHVGLLTSDINVRLEKVYSQFEMWIQIWLNLYRREMIERNSLRFPNMPGEDEPFFVAMLCCAEKFYCVPDHYYIYNRRSGSETQSNSSERAAKGVAAMIEGCRYINAEFARHQSIGARAKSICLQELIERINRNYILRRYDGNALLDADAVENFIRALEPTFNGSSEMAARLL